MNTHLKLTSFKTTAHSSKIGFFQGHLWISGQWLLSRPLHWIIQEFNSPWYSLQNDSFQDQLHTVEILASFKIIWGFYFIFGATDVFQDHLKRKNTIVQDHLFISLNLHMGDTLQSGHLSRPLEKVTFWLKTINRKDRIHRTEDIKTHHLPWSFHHISWTVYKSCISSAISTSFKTILNGTVQPHKGNVVY